MDSDTAHIWFWHGGDPYAMQLVPLEKVPLVLCCFKEATAAVFFPTTSTSDRAQVPRSKGFSFSSESARHVGSATSASATSQSSPLEMVDPLEALQQERQARERNCGATGSARSRLNQKLMEKERLAKMSRKPSHASASPSAKGPPNPMIR